MYAVTCVRFGSAIYAVYKLYVSRADILRVYVPVFQITGFVSGVATRRPTAVGKQSLGKKRTYIETTRFYRVSRSQTFFLDLARREIRRDFAYTSFGNVLHN